MVGNVTDPSGAAVSGATVKITQTATNDTRSAQTDVSGAYTISTVTPGTYRVEITRDGFSTFVATEVLVNQNVVVRVNAQLQVGALTQTVEVTATTAELQTERADVHAEIGAENLVDLPQPTRAFTGLLEMVPGVTPPGGQIGGGTNNPSKSMGFSFNGTGGLTSTVRIEGVNALIPWGSQGLSSNVVPAIEAIQNVNAVTNASDAEQGMSGGATVNVMLKSGTNDTHGGFYDYNISSWGQANNFFAPPGSKPPHLVDNDLGFFAGGHVIRNKLFYFGSYEVDLNHAADAGVLSFPGSVQLTGDLTGSANPIYDPSTGNADGSGRTPFSGNTIPSSRISPVTAKIIPNIPKTNYGGYGAAVNNFYMNRPKVYNLHKIDTKLDWMVNSKLRLSGRWSYDPYYDHNAPCYGEILGGYNCFPGASGGGNYTEHGAGLAVSGSGTYVVSPTMVVDATWGMSSSHQVLTPNLADQAYGRDVLGIPGTNPGPLPFYGGVPNFAISSFTTMGASWPSLEYFQPVYEYTANITKIQGSHTIRFGADMTYFHMRSHEIGQNTFTFNGAVTTVKGGPGANSYNSVADFLLGQFQSASVDKQYIEPYVNWKAYQWMVYVRDQWHVNSKLTVNYGVRWEYYPPNKRDNGSLADGDGLSFLDPTAGTITVCGGSSPLPSDCGISYSKKLFSPSIGIAYRPTEKLVIRAGYSISPMQDQVGRGQYSTYPGRYAIQLSGANPYSAGGSLVTGLPLATPPVGTNGVYKIPKNLGNLGGLFTKSPFVRGYSQTYNFTIQRQLPGDMLGSVGYVGTHSVHLLSSININYGQIGGGNASQLLSWIPVTGTVSTPTPWGYDTYNSLQATLQKRMSKGLTLQAAYTFSKDISMGSSILIPQYIYMDHALSSSDRPHHLSMSGTYELPFGASKPFAQHGVGAALLGDWTVNAIFHHYSGTPFSISSSSSTLNAPGNSQTADQVLPNVGKVGDGLGGQAYFNPLAFRPVTRVGFGTAGFNILRGPGNTNGDLALTRVIRLGERFRMQLRADSMNFTNTPHFSNPGSNVSNLQLNSDGTVRNLNGFSVITGTSALSRAVDARYFRFSFRVAF